VEAVRPAPFLAAILLALVAVAHLLRFLFRIEVVAGGVVVPLWVSLLGFLVPGALAVALWRGRRS
jgi:hypothetical protein